MCIKKNYAAIRAKRIYWSPADHKLKNDCFILIVWKYENVQLNLQMIATLNNISLPLNPIDTFAKISKLLKLVPLTKVMLIMVSFINKGAKRNLFE